jgi:DnaJ-class molecular chaperone
MAFMADKRDYYEVLGVGKNATPDEIKQAYRKLAREHHPDMAKEGDKEAAEKRFKEINEAYQVLGDTEKRKMYDQYGHAGVGAGAQGYGNGASGFGNGGQWGPFTYTYSTGGAGGANPFGGFGQSNGEEFDPFDVFEDFFGFRGFGGQRKPRKGKNLYYEMPLDFKDAVCGIEKEVTVESGKVTIKIPQGVRNGTELRFAEKGMPGLQGVPAGDLFITLRVKTPAEFAIDGDNVYSEVSIDFVTAILGGSLEISVINPASDSGLGKATLKIPAGTQPGTRFLVRGKGMPRLHGRGQGDVIVQIAIDIPKKLSKKQKDLLEEYRK